MKVYKGTVLFIDLLGFAALTQGDVKIYAKDFATHSFKTDDGVNEHIFCAKLLAKFRRHLSKFRTPSIKVAQLSDAAFLWSNDTDTMVEVARKLMWVCLSSGLLCRSGLAYGEIIEPDLVNMKIGAFICGKAVTDAVKIESRGKGARIFVGETLHKNVVQIPKHIFSLCAENLEGSDAKEFPWFLYPKLNKDDDLFRHYHSSNFTESNKKAIEKLLDIIKDPRMFRWNYDSELGRVQMESTINFFSRNRAIKIE